MTGFRESDALLGKKAQFLVDSGSRLAIRSPFTLETTNEKIRRDDTVTRDIWSERIIPQRVPNCIAQSASLE